MCPTNNRAAHCAGVPVGHFSGGQSVMPYMGMASQGSMGLPNQSAIAQGMAAGMMQQGMHSAQSMPNQGMPQQNMHGDMMMQQHTHVQGPMEAALGMDAFSSADLLNDAFPNFPSPVVDTQSSSSQHQDESGATAGKSAKSEPQIPSTGSAPVGKNGPLQRNLRKLSVKSRAKSVGQASNPSDTLTTAMQNVQMQMSMAMPVVGPGSWLSPSTLDTSQDGVRRPPAA